MRMSDKEILDPQAVLDGVPTGLWIDGRCTPAADGGTFEVYDAATEESLVSVADAGVADARRALDSDAARSSAGPSSCSPIAPTTSPC